MPASNNKALSAMSIFPMDLTDNSDNKDTIKWDTSPLTN